MDKKNIYFWIAGFFSIFIYLLFLYFIFSFLGRYEIKYQKYTAKKNNFIEVTISQAKNTKKNIIRKKRESEIKNTKKNIKKISKKYQKRDKIRKSIQRTKISNSLKSLFNGIDTNKYIKNKKNNTLRKKIITNINSRIFQKQKIGDKNSSASKIIKNLSLIKLNSSIIKNNGKYDKYIGKISDILDQKWQETPGTIAGNQATVTVKIDKFGNFSYKIDSLSYNNEFNAKLQNFLENLKDEKFPPYAKGNFVELKVNFKDE